jgi:hypothetical protein
MFVTGASLQVPPGTAPAGQIQAARLDGPLAGDSPRGGACLAVMGGPGVT